jgi:hypothetical protein
LHSQKKINFSTENFQHFAGISAKNRTGGGMSFANEQKPRRRLPMQR